MATGDPAATDPLLAAGSPLPGETVINGCAIHKRSTGLADAYTTDDVDEALNLLEQGKRVNLTQPEQLSTLINKLAAIGQDAMDRGSKAPLYNLCDIAVAGTSIFCSDNKGIGRIDMPQLRGKPMPGSRADRYLHPDRKGEVDLSKGFTDYLTHDRGAQVSTTVSFPEFLHATQGELNGAKVAAMAHGMELGKVPPGDVWISRDNYILDGHHRWAAAVTLSRQKGELIPINVKRIDIDIMPLLEEAKHYAAWMGLAQMAASAAQKSLFATV